MYDTSRQARRLALDRMASQLAAEWANGTLRQIRKASRVVPSSWPRRLDDARLIVGMRARAEDLDHTKRELLARLVHEAAVRLWPNVATRHQSHESSE